MCVCVYVRVCRWNAFFNHNLDLLTSYAASACCCAHFSQISFLFLASSLCVFVVHCSFLLHSACHRSARRCVCLCLCLCLPLGLNTSRRLSTCHSVAFSLTTRFCALIALSPSTPLPAEFHLSSPSFSCDMWQRICGVHLRILKFL